MQYLAPIVGEFCATVAAPPQDEWARFFGAAHQTREGQNRDRVEVISNGVRAAAFEGDYVAIS